MNTDERFARLDSENKVLSVKIRHEADSDPDLSALGEYTDSASEWAIVRATGEYVADTAEDALPEPGREYRFFLPYAAGQSPGSADYRTYGLADWERMEAYDRQDWWMLGIWAEAEIVVAGVTQIIRSGGLWGVESDSGEGYLAHVGKEELAALDAILGQLGLSREGVEVETAD